MRRSGRFLLILVLAVSLRPAFAQTAPALDIRIERDERPRALSSELAVNLAVTVSQRGTGTVPEDNFEVYASAGNANGEETEIFPCAQEHDHSPEVPRGIYLCTVIVDHGGRWTFQSVVNRLRANAAEQPVSLGDAARAFDVDTDEVAAGPSEASVKGSVTEVALLWSHAAFAIVWLAGAALLTLLALPAARLRLSTFGLHRLEERFDVLVKSTWVATGVLVASGIYLLLNQTAYETPFSSSAIDAVFNLPYGKPYFLALAAKLGLYALMVAASIAILREARRQLHSSDDARPPRQTSRGPVRVGAVVLVAGAVGISASVTLLKYFHELIESARALL